MRTKGPCTCSVFGPAGSSSHGIASCHGSALRSNSITLLGLIIDWLDIGTREQSKAAILVTSHTVGGPSVDLVLQDPIEVIEILNLNKELQSDNMVTVAVSGGTGGLGRTVLDAIAKSGKHNAIILSRKVSLFDVSNACCSHLTELMQTTSATDTNGFKCFAVDYENVEQIEHVLEANNVAVVVSCLVLVDEASAQSQINLIRAAARTTTVDRFIPTEYYLDFHAPIP
jgi:hypothetical protein